MTVGRLFRTLLCDPLVAYRPQVWRSTASTGEHRERRHDHEYARSRNPYRSRRMHAWIMLSKNADSNSQTIWSFDAARLRRRREYLFVALGEPLAGGCELAPSQVPNAFRGRSVAPRSFLLRRIVGVNIHAGEPDAHHR
jgi:hypothetical protein